MAIIAKESKRDWTPAPEGLHQAVCCDVVDLGLVETEWGKKQKCRLIFQVALLNDDGTEDLCHDTDPPRRFELRRDFGLSLSEKSSLRPFLESWRGRKFTKEELAGFDLEHLLGVNCQLQVIHHITDQGKTFANIQAAVPLGKNTPKIRSLDYVRVVDREKSQTEGGPSDYNDDDIPF